MLASLPTGSALWTGLASVAALGRRLGLHVTAEGVEHPEQAELLAELGCTSAQGFLYSPAVPAADVELLFDHHFA